MITLAKILPLRLRSAFWRREDGAVLVEALAVVPFVTLFTAGILEFGNIFWERMQIDAGLRDAGRYLSRCRPTSPTYTANCTEATAKLIAFYGTQSPAANAPLRVRGWGPSLADITVTPVSADGTITIATAHLYETSPLFSGLGVGAITITSSHEERYIGW
ncbi:pilus assembly protein [Sinorhizobium sp. 8-89]|uniref:TadE/TadG family type IV pilus assembly protein n=1 Tax=Sinorhizobium sp. 7-81 TaxID=3049087 RepID=UPI0024C218F7|nr:pilus assembly protein [Sinorhizobium sp. 7-81]MDK1389206.1 pilus assembly protein [Sinorhizobium sp. 7-81]